MNAQRFVCYKYIYNVKYNSLLPQRSKWPKETVLPKLRNKHTVFMENGVEKKIIYPQELCYDQVEPSDLVENMIIYIKNTFPDWREIEVTKIKN